MVQSYSDLVIVLAREDDIHLDALQTMIEQFQLCEWGNCRLDKTASFSGNNVWIMGRT
jgi:hypothetical protein